MTKTQREKVMMVVADIESSLDHLDDVLVDLAESRDKNTFYDIGWVRENALIHSIDLYKINILNASAIIKKSI